MKPIGKNIKKKNLTYRQLVEFAMRHYYDCNLISYDNFSIDESIIEGVRSYILTDNITDHISLDMIEFIMLIKFRDFYRPDEINIKRERSICIKIYTKLIDRKITIETLDTDKIEECPICFSDNELKCLSCTHKFCENCLNSLIKIDINLICPLCRDKLDVNILYNDTHIIPLSKTDQNLIINNIMSLYNNMKRYKLENDFRNFSTKFIIKEVASHFGIYNDHIDDFKKSYDHKFNALLDRLAYLRSNERIKVHSYKKNEKEDYYIYEGCEI